jgi:hypothetical protein
MKKSTNILFAVLVLILTGCVMKATLVDITNGVKLNAKFTDSNSTGGKCEVLMPDGELLTGRYSGIRGTDEVSFSNAIGNNSNGSYSLAGSTRTRGGQGKAYAILTSTKPGSTLVMEIIAIYNVLEGGGVGDAKTNDGRVYKVIF